MRTTNFEFESDLEIFKSNLIKFCEREDVQQEIVESQKVGEHLLEGEIQANYTSKFWNLMAKEGLLGIVIPEKYGGSGRTHMELSVFYEIMGYYLAPMRAYLTTAVATNVILNAGSEEQKQRYLSGISNGNYLFCQGYTEPGAGSDLASLSTKAEKQGDNYIINGQKIFSSHAHVSQYCLLLARTDSSVPKHKGLSLFIMDMKTPGIEVGPLWTLGGGRVNVIYLSNVKIPTKNLIGEENKGWNNALRSLNFERSTTLFVGICYYIVEELASLCKMRNIDSKTNNCLISRLTELSAKLEGARLLAYRVACMQKQGIMPSYETSVAKVLITELSQEIALLGMKMLGTSRQLRMGDCEELLGGKIEALYRYARSATITAGSSEVQRNIIAQKGLELPRI